MSTENGRRNPRSTVATRVPGIPKVPTKISAELRHYLTTLGEALEIRLGRKGDPRDRAVTLRELTDGDLSGTTLRVGGVTTTGPDDDGTGGTAGTPVTPAGFLVTGGFSNISLRWNWPGSSYSGHSYTEIWRHTADVRGSATRIGISPGTTFVDYCGGNQTFYYWIRHVNIDGLTGPFNATSGTLGQTQPDTTYLTSLLASSITSSELAGSLATPIALIPSLEAFVGYSSSYTGNSLLTRMGSVETVAGAAATSAQLQQEVTTLTNADSAITSSVTTLSSTVNDPTTGLAAAHAAVATEATARANADSALSQTVSTLQTTVNGNTTSIQTNAASVDGLEAQYTVKIDAAGHVAGFGLANSAATATPTSEFYVRADKFALLPAATSVTSFPTTGNYQNRAVFRSDLYNSATMQPSDATYYYDTSTSSYSLTPSSLPFVVVTSPQTIQGETVPAGVYLDTAYMNKGRVLDLVAGSVVADYISATVAMDAPYLFGGTINVGQINKPTTDPRTWTVSGNTRVSNFSVDALGVMHANSAVMEGITIKAPDGTVLVDAGGMTGSSGGNLIYNAHFRRGELTFNSSTSTWTEDVYLVDGFTSYGGGTVLERKDLGYIRAGDGSTGTGYVRSNKQRFPVVAGETLYLYAQTGSDTGVYMNIAYYDHSDGTDTTGYITQTAVSAANGDFDNKAVTGAGGATRRSLIAAVTVPSTTGAHYGEIRFGSDTGDYAYFYNVGVSRTPPEISPQYAATYIRDLSVDTLQIAGNAVTVPLGQSDVNVGDWVTWSGTNSNTAIGTSWGTVANTGSVGGITAIPLSWANTATAPTALNIFGCVNFLGQSGSDYKTIRARLVYSTSASLTNPVQIQQVGASLKTDNSMTLSLNATVDVSDEGLNANTNYYFGLQVHGNDQGGTGPTPWKIGNNGITVLAAKK